MEKGVLRATFQKEEMRFLSLALLGCGLLTLGSLVRIPLYPVPFTLQTLALFILALTQTPKQACASALCYLSCATIGLPVLGGTVNFLWIIGKSGGYLVAFPIAAYAMASLRQKIPALSALLCGQAIISAVGWIWLAPFLGAKVAFLKGVLLFLPSSLFKALAAIAFAKWRRR